jgi:SAM-dependent methyltransferase
MASIPLEKERDAWDREYRSKGRKYGRAPGELPHFPPGSLILEAGCGDGKTVTAMVTRCWDVVAIDFSMEALRLSQRNPLLPDIACIQADLRALPFRGEVFDGVFLIHSAGHSLEPSRNDIVREAARVLKYGGRLFFRAFSCGDFRSGKGTRIEPGTWIRGDGIPTHYFTLDEVVSLFYSLHMTEIRETCWTMRVKERLMKRAEIVAEFVKGDPQGRRLNPPLPEKFSP